MEINTAVKAVHDLAVEKGWYDNSRAPLEFHMLMVSEIAEATEAVRAGEPAIHYGELNPPMPEYLAKSKNILVNSENKKQYLLSPANLLEKVKPEGEAIELADSVIRIMDYFAHRGWDLEEAIRIKHGYNMTRPYRHGNKTV